MIYLIEQLGLLAGGLASVLFIFIRYAFFAGLAFLIFYHWKKKRFERRKIQANNPKRQRIWEEVRHSSISTLVFALVGLGIFGLSQLGLSKVYTDLGAYGWAYLPFSFAVLIVAHDTYFYWVHRLMHHPRLFRVFHLVHHRSNNPTPWASLAFHPLEAFVEIAIIPLIVCMLPVHHIVLLAFASWSLTWNIIGHLGFELFPAGWVNHPITKWLNTSTHHNMHHRYSRGNYGLYFNWWDSWMGTNHPDYQSTFQQITSDKREREDYYRTTSVAP